MAQGENADPLFLYQGIFNGELTPLQKLATRLLSVCCNSASCERLFSMFGLTLTRLRSRLRPQSMVDFAELRMHLRDEHLRCGLLKESLKRKITSHSECKEPPEHPTSVSPLPSTSQEIQRDDNDDHDSDDHDDGEEEEEEEDDEEEEGEDEADELNSTGKGSSRIQSFTSIARELGKKAAEVEAEESDSEDDIVEIMSFPAKIPLRDLFDFNNMFWKVSQTSSMRSLSDEMELHQLLDLDAEGELDDEIAFDQGNADVVYASL